jgi:hypothetical protein
MKRKRVGEGLSILSTLSEIIYVLAPFLLVSEGSYFLRANTHFKKIKRVRECFGVNVPWILCHHGGNLDLAGMCVVEFHHAYWQSNGEERSQQCASITPDFVTELKTPEGWQDMASGCVQFDEYQWSLLLNARGKRLVLQVESFEGYDIVCHVPLKVASEDDFCAAIQKLCGLAMREVVAQVRTRRS